MVANHSSHADTAALLAALDATHAPAIGAAADYWFASPWRARICSRLAAGFPVRRSGGGMDDLLGMADTLRAGRAVVLFPEGTRARAGELGSFHRGALVLAEHARVPVVPVAIAGTDRLLPKHGRLRPALVRVRIGRRSRTRRLRRRPVRRSRRCMTVRSRSRCGTPASARSWPA